MFVSRYCCSIYPMVVYVVLGCFYQFFFVLFYVVFESLNLWINTIFNAGDISSCFHLDSLDCQRHFWEVWPDASFEVFLYSSPFFKFFTGPLQEWSGVSYIGDSLDVSHFDKTSVSLLSSSVLVLWRFIFKMWSFRISCMIVSSSNIPKYL